MIKQKSYKQFSLNAHLGNLAAGHINTCQLELTYACSFHCGYCYLQCFNNAASIKTEISTAEIKTIIDNLKKAGVLWLCFTGGDPLAHPDFTEIYQYAYKQGFILIIFTNGYLLDKHITMLKKMPPLSIEITINASEKDLYETISRVPNSFNRVKKAINILNKNRLPFKLKAMGLKENSHHLLQLKKFARNYHQRLAIDYFIHAGLQHEKKPLSFAIPPKQTISNNCPHQKITTHKNNILFECNLTGNDTIHIDPWGNIALCALLRYPKINILKKELKKSLSDLLKYYRAKKGFKSKSPCRGCLARSICGWCPGKAYVETRSLEKPIAYCIKGKNEDPT